MENKKTHRGLTMYEALAWTILAIIVIAGAVALISKVFNTFDTGKEVSNVQQIMTNTRGLLKYRGQYSDTNMIQSLIKYDGLPSSMIADTAGTTAKNGWGGDVTLSASSDKYTYTLTYDKVPKTACITMVSKLRESSLIGKINDTAIDTVEPETVCSADETKISFTSNS
ncbi:type 4 pilus major pilin [Pantoea agglomerans]|uniref:type 4 pilus major pilin n=1 Tax=Enterobacter agglomerans TaxID=549 RepID=UPI00241311DB|nr:type 4 pilus major pilin [Pantoea agglomerans]